MATFLALAGGWCVNRDFAWHERAKFKPPDSGNELLPFDQDASWGADAVARLLSEPGLFVNVQTIPFKRGKSTLHALERRPPHKYIPSDPPHLLNLRDELVYLPAHFPMHLFENATVCAAVVDKETRQPVQAARMRSTGVLRAEDSLGPIFFCALKGLPISVPNNAS